MKVSIRILCPFSLLVGLGLLFSIGGCKPKANEEDQSGRDSVISVQSSEPVDVDWEYHYRGAPRDSAYNCYLLQIPSAGSIRGLIIRDFSSLPDTSQTPRFDFNTLAAENNFLVMYTVSSRYFPELFYNDLPPTLLDEMVNEVVQRFKINNKPIFIGGISASGTRALRYAQFCAEGKSLYDHKISGVFAVDAPLDLERFYNSAKRILDLEHENGMKEEAEMILDAFPEVLGGSPEEAKANYVQASVYSYSDEDGGNVSAYRNTPIVIWHEPDTDWWIENRSASFYDINSADITAFVVHLRALGNNQVVLHTTSGKGKNREGERKPHSWSIVDEEVLFQWLVSLCEKENTAS